MSIVHPMNAIRLLSKKDPDHTYIPHEFIQDKKISFECIGLCGMYLAEAIEWDEIPNEHQETIEKWFWNNGYFV